MNLTTAVRTCLAKYATFDGRARRSEFWLWTLFTAIVAIATGVLDSVLPTPTLGRAGGGLLSILSTLVLLLPTIAVAVRRLHDTSRSGWWFLLVLVPVVGWIVLLVLYCLASTPGANSYGAGPVPGHDAEQGLSTRAG